MTEVKSMFVCADFVNPLWELPIDAPPGVRRTLIGWRVAPEPVDAGVPEPVARLIVSALVSHARVTFAEGPKGKPSFVHTTDANEALRLFDTDCFDWSQRGQVVFLSSPSTPPPTVSLVHLNAAFEGAQFGRIAETGATGFLVPGVDGDVAGLYTFDDRLSAEIVSGLRSSSEDAGAIWQEVDEAEFADLLAGRR